MPDESFLLKRARTRVVRGLFPAFILCAVSATSVSCGSDDFCSQGSYECSGSSPPPAGTSGSGGSAGAAIGGTGQGGYANAAGSFASGGLAGQSALGEGGVGESASGGTATGGSTGTSGGGEGGEGGDGPSVCDPASPVAGCILLRAASGIYVAAHGDDQSEGTQDRPVATLTHAIELAADDQLPIFVCSGTYDEHVEITTSGLALHGSYGCDNSVWSYDPSKPSRIAPSSKTEALRVSNVNGLDVYDLELASANASEPGASSVAVFLTVSDGVTFTRVHVIAGNGAKGADGTLEPFSYRNVSELDGHESTSDSGADALDCTCEASSEHTRGARGGDGGQDGGTGEPSDLGGGQPGAHGASCSNGGLGEDAPAADGGPGAMQSGSLTVDGWTAMMGGDGANGRPGQGGGGGGGGKTSGYGGGGGGACGGCGGKGGGGGGGGGASIAVLAVGASVTLNHCLLETATAGAGGRGAHGQVGQGGGIGGVRYGSACNGGNGGQGGHGGPGGGGAGGISVAIVATDGSGISFGPDSTILPGTPGPGGLGGGPDNSGLPGVAQPALEL